jgi:hypothetical protein
MFLRRGSHYYWQEVGKTSPQKSFPGFPIHFGSLERVYLQPVIMVKDVSRHKKCRIYLEDDELEVEKWIYLEGRWNLF